MTKERRGTISTSPPDDRENMQKEESWRGVEQTPHQQVIFDLKVLDSQITQRIKACKNVNSTPDLTTGVAGDLPRLSKKLEELVQQSTSVRGTRQEQQERTAYIPKIKGALDELQRLVSQSE